MDITKKSQILNMLSDSLVELLSTGAVGILPTDTVYGLACSAREPAAVTRLYSLKSRTQKPGTIIAASIQQLIDLGFSGEVLGIAENYWPGPFSVVLPAGEHLAYLHQGKNSLAVRIPNDRALVRLLNQTGPLMTSSANLPDQTPANTINAAKIYFSNSVDFYVDGGDYSNRASSTVLGIENGQVVVWRQGAGYEKLKETVA